MTTTPEQIHTLLPAIMADIGAIEKGKKNREQNYRFRSVDDVLNALHPLLCKHGVSLGLDVTDHKVESRQEAKAGGRGERSVTRATLMLTVRFMAPDGSCRTFSACGEGLDFGGDKATAKATSAAFKYAMLLGLCVPVEAADIDDGDQEGPAAAAEPTPDPVPEPPKEKPVYSESLGALCSDDQKSKIKTLAVELKGDDAKDWLKAVLEKHGKTALADLTVDQAIKLIAKLEQLNTEKQAAALL